MTTTLTFLGAAGTVTGSKYLLDAGRKVLIDCGLFQGYKQLRLRNRAPFPVDPKTLDAVILTHAHLDHTGYLPLLVKNGYRGRVYCTAATRDLCQILLPDSGRLQEEEAEHANRHAYSKHRPALPLYTAADAEQALKFLTPVDFEREVRIADPWRFQLHRAGHLLGAAMARISDGERSILFSGDLGRPNDTLMQPPASIAQTDFLVLESTYGNRQHAATDPERELADVIKKTAARGGIVIVPSFAVGRAQALLYLISKLKRENRIPDVPVYLNSPMARDATEIYIDHPGDHRLSPAQCKQMHGVARIVNTVDESRQLDQLRGPAVIIAGSGMATGGRVLHHLKKFLPDPKHTVLFVGFQAGGTRGEALLNGATTIKIYGEYVPVRAEIALLDALSAHADADEILAWLGGFQAPPKRTFVTHGEPAAADRLRLRIEEALGWQVTVPEYRDTVAL